MHFHKWIVIGHSTKGIVYRCAICGKHKERKKKHGKSVTLP